MKLKDTLKDTSMKPNYIQPDWPAPSRVRAYSTTRNGGFSQGVYASFNLGHNIGDAMADVAANRQLLCQQLNLPSAPKWLRQVHGNQVVDAGNCADAQEMIQADGSYTRKPGVVCIITTADCVPLILCDNRGTQVAAIHVGWGGLVAGIIGQAITNMQSKYPLLAWLGPAIGPEKFEVDKDVCELLQNTSRHGNYCTQQTSNNKYLVDLYQLAREILSSCGVTAIYGGNNCTYIEEQLFFSYRRDKGATGRMATLIWLDD